MMNLKGLEAPTSQGAEEGVSKTIQNKEDTVKKVNMVLNLTLFNTMVIKVLFH